ncbi:MAG TPA: hypothetical protein VGN83_02375 [Falsiroseomonas sp.]|nr:hypothetical protein [Falsiroseomonas sp.]
MADDLPPLPSHGATMFHGLRLDAYSLDLPEGGGQGGEQAGDRASRRAFDAILDGWRRRLRAGAGGDPFGRPAEERIGKHAMDDALTRGAPEAAGVVLGAIEDYAEALAEVVKRFLKLPDWRGTQRILVGGGLRAARSGEVAIGRAAVRLRADGVEVRLSPIRHDPDDAGLIGAARLLPAELLGAADAVLAADLGGTSFRAGVVLPRLGVSPDLAAAGVWRRQSWRHAEEEEVDRATALGRLAGMLADLAGEADAAGISIAPVVAVGLPGVLDAEGKVLRGAENLPGDWLAEGFRLPLALSRLLPRTAGGLTPVLLHNDAVAQGLSQAPFVRDVAHWGMLTIGTGLGNARFTNVTPRD